MKGEHKGDFSRDTFDPSKHFLRVLMQQGRVSLDADWNEQVDILLHYMQTLARDIIGPYGGPGFKITPVQNGFNIGYGRYYVDGILCENEKKVSCGANEDDEDPGIWYYDQQPDYPIKSETSIPKLSENDLSYLVYLDVWERHISSVEDDYIREKALGGPDTASRSKVVWQVKVPKKSDNWWTQDYELSCENIRTYWDSVVKTFQPKRRGCLKARANKPPDKKDPCITSPEARYRGEENQLYRVEIHRGGDASAATFKWSRDNGSVIYPILGIDENKIITLEHLGRDDRLGLKKGDWVEVMDDDYTLLVQSRPSPLLSGSWPRPLAHVEEVDLAGMKVTLTLEEDYVLPSYDDIKDKHPFLRRWDYREPDPTKQDEPKFADEGFSALQVEEGSCEGDDGWLTLEDGVQICFLPSPDQDDPNIYQAGDYWLIPARTAMGDVEWPKDPLNPDSPRSLPPHGIEHHYAPLAFIQTANGGEGTPEMDCRCEIKTTCYPP
jgi:hypothetical protein